MAQRSEEIFAYRTNLYLNRAPSASISPVVGCGKWIGKTYWRVPAISVRNFRRERAACARSQSKIVDQSASRHCKAWCMRSPITTACCPRERILTQQWQGEWPGIGPIISSAMVAAIGTGDAFAKGPLPTPSSNQFQA